jgi:hypothetical protein
MDEDVASGEFKPPYMSFQTFWTFLDELTSKPLPPQIDRSLLSTKSGTDQANLLAALKSFDFVSDNLAVMEPLRLFAAGDAEIRLKILEESVLEFYVPQLAVSAQNGTEKQLLDSFEVEFGYTGETRRKAATFFLHAARAAGITLSPHFPNTRSGSGSGTARRRPSVRKRPGDPPPPAPPPATTQGTTRSVALASGGAITLTVSVDLFDLSETDRAFVLDFIDKLKGYGEQRALTTGATDNVEEGEVEA